MKKRKLPVRKHGVLVVLLAVIAVTSYFVLPGSGAEAADAAPPTVSITSPVNGEVVSGRITVTAVASDDVGVVGVQFQVDKKNMGPEDTVEPYSLTGDTTKISDGPHLIRAVARDAAGNKTISEGVSVTVLNNPTSEVKVPLTDMGSTGNYFGFKGGLYENGSNNVPADHDSAGRFFTSRIFARSASGIKTSDGKIVLMSIGFSNPNQEWCADDPEATTCNSWSFMGLATSSTAVSPSVAVVNGAYSGQETSSWDQAYGTDPDIDQAKFTFTNNYDRIRDTVLAPNGLSEQQVQVLWVKLTNANPGTPGAGRSTLPDASADVYDFETKLGNAVRAMKVRYPNLRQVFLSTRTYGGYSTIALSPEPYVYENGYGAKWLIQAQIDQIRNNGTIVDSRAGDLNYNTGNAPWIAWGPYFWTDGATPRQYDGFFWLREDVELDGVHPTVSGETKAANQLMNFFMTSPYTTWFRI